MSDFTAIQIEGEKINVKDQTARDTAEAAAQNARDAKIAASQAAQAVQNVNQAIADANEAISDLNEQIASLDTNFASQANNVSISELQTTAKTLVGALNELNIKSHTIPDRFYMTMIASEVHKKIHIAFKSGIRNFFLVFGSANQDPYVGVADVKAINEISDVNNSVSLVRGDTPNSYVINCPEWSTFFIVGDKNYLGEAEITYSD